jgi:glycyl-tRNA synthetase
VYFRPETAQGMFVNFKNILDAYQPKLPFGMAQIGKAFRNEITPRDFIFRVREFEQMEIEYFVDPRDSKKVENTFNDLYQDQIDFLEEIGVDSSKIHKIEVPESDRAHYSSRSVDTEFDFPFGQKELLGLAYRTDYDLSAHSKASGVKLAVFDEEAKEWITPHCIEPTFGVERLILALLTSVYKEDEQGGEARSYLALKPSIAPIVCAVSPLLKNRPELQTKAREVFAMLKQEFGNVMYDDNGNVGKRYRRQDEIGTPWCIVVDFDTIGMGDNINPDFKDMVTVRDRDTGEQVRIAISELVSYINSKMQ